MNPSEFISNQREILSLVARMLIAKSKIIVEESSVSILIPEKLLDVAQSEKLQGELSSAATAEFPTKSIEISVG